MSEENRNDKQPATFAFGIRQFKDESSRMQVDTLNTGIAEGDILLIVETWLEKSREDYKNKIKQSFSE